MKGLAKLQLVGPLVLFGLICAAEGAAHALTQYPTSERLWYINLEWFAPFQRSHYFLSDYVSVTDPQLLIVACPLLLMALIGIFSRFRLSLAIASNLSFVYASIVTYFSFHVPTTAQASLAISSIRTAPDAYLLMLLVGASLISFVISHVLYLHEVRASI